MGSPRVWAIVLAGGEGARLLPLTRYLTGDNCPKQFCALHGPRTLLGQTLARIAPLVPPERTVVVGMEAHAEHLRRDVPGSVPYTLVQPANKGTGPAVLWPAHWISRHDREAIVVIFPSDHFVLQERALMAHVARAVGIVRERPETVVLLGMDPDGPEEDYGWIEPGEALPGVSGCFRVREFWEKPTVERARAFFRFGFLWNSLIVVARADALEGLGRAYLPEVDARLARLEAFAGTRHEPWAVEQAYAWMRPASFSRDVLAGGAEPLVVLPVYGVLWSDWGTPERVVRTLRRIRASPAWLDAWIQGSKVP
ncbi:MAG: NTP transferase domain-containing protein, partial [Candidatus Rokubacteria bacterium]|nr:NTP transferase domain-containing protein [Candidatus Rokubacteria bacterium]